jgi:hypothetical protein
MIATTSPILSDLRGQAGSDVFRTIHDNVVIRKQYTRFKSYPLYAATQKSNFVQLTKWWGRETGVFRQGWISLAAQLAISKIKFFNKPLNGFNLYLSCHLNKWRWGLHTLFPAPDFTVFGKFPNFSFLVSVVFHTEYLKLVTWEIGFTNIELRAAPPKSVGVSNTNCYRYIYHGPINLNEDLDISAFYSTAFPFNSLSQNKHFWQFRYINPDAGVGSFWYSFNTDVS